MVTVPEIGKITALIHNTRNILKILDPTTLPIAISDFFFMTATIEVVSSGKEVPKATIVNHMTDCDNQRTFDIFIAPLTIHSPQIVKPTNQTTIYTTILTRDIDSISTSTGRSCFLFTI